MLCVPVGKGVGRNIGRTIGTQGISGVIAEPVGALYPFGKGTPTVGNSGAVTAIEVCGAIWDCQIYERNLQGTGEQGKDCRYCPPASSPKE